MSTFLKSTSYLLLFIIFTTLSSFTECIIEIPLKIIRKRNPNQKYKNTTIKSEPSISDFSNPLDFFKSFSESGEYEINDNLLFLATVKIGSDSQSFNLVLDTGSSILWVAQKGSKDTGTINRHFNPSTSTSCSKTTEYFNQAYGSGSCSGYFYTDVVSYIGNTNFKMLFGVASTTDFEVEDADGIIGLARTYPESGKSLIMSLYKNKVISSRAFSFKFTRVYYGEKATFYIGKHDDFSKSETSSCSLLDTSDYEKMLWACEMTGMSLKDERNKTISASGSYSVIFDSGTNVITMPLGYLYDIMNDVSQYGCTVQYSDATKSSYQLKCGSTLPDFLFTIDYNTYKIPSEFNYYKLGAYYYSRIIFQNSDIYIFGAPFFFTFHTLFNHDDKKLYFYPEDVNNLIKGSYWTPGKIALIIILTALIIITIFVICHYIKWRKSTKTNDEINNIGSGNYFI